MRRVLCVAAALVAAAVVAPSAALAETEDVDCASLEHLRIANLDQYDFTTCTKGDHHNRARDGYVASELEVLVAQSRATFVVLRYEEAGRYTYFPAGSVADVVSDMFGRPMRNWGEERKYGRFGVAPVEIKITDESPYLSCFAYARRWGVVGLAPGHKYVLFGIYCAMDTLEPTNGEIEEFLDGVAF